MCYIQNEDLKATLKSVMEAESFIHVTVIGVSTSTFKCYFVIVFNFVISSLEKRYLLMADL